MTESQTKPSKSILETIERMSELLLGLIVGRGFTGSVNPAQVSRAEIRTTWFDTIGC